MLYIMKLNSKYFKYMKEGTKILEIRLNDEKRKNISIGDEIIFKKEPELKEQLKTEVIGLIYKKSFIDVVEEFNVSDYSDIQENKDSFLEDLYKFYTKEDESKYGVVGIKIKKGNIQ